jgi:hypothetical protein
MDVTCPSNWGKEDCKEWVSKLLTPQEKTSVVVQEQGLMEMGEEV